MKILIVDDKIENNYLLESLLKGNGYEIVSAKNGAEALGLANKEKPDLIVADILMPVMDGYTLCRECKKNDKLKSVPFIFYTATYTDPKDEEFALSLGADRFILKPQDPDVFINIIEECIKETSNKDNKNGIIPDNPETVILKEYNQTLIRKLEDKMMQTEENEKELKKIVSELEKSLSEQKKAEETLRERENFLSSILENIPDMIFIKDAKELKFIRFNRAGENLLGQKRDALIGKNDYDLFPKEQADFFTKSDREVIESKKLKDILEEFINTKNGKRILHTKKLPILDKDKNPIYLLGISEDITEQKRAQMALEESEEKYRTLISQSPDGIFIIDLNGNFLSVNKTMCNVLGFNEEKFLTMKLWDIVPMKYSEQFKGRLAKIIKGEKITEAIEYEAKGRDGKTFYVEVLSAPYYKENKLIGFQGIARDITERKIAEKQIVLLAHSLKSVSECISITNENNEIIFINEAFLKTYGYTENELLGKNISIVQCRNEETNDRFDSILSGTIDGGWEGEVLNKRKDGSVFSVYLSTSVVKNGNDNPIALIGVARDITEMKKNREELIRAKEKAEEMNKLKSYFFANMSHELRTPFVGILSGAEILSESITDPESKEIVNIILQASKRLVDTLNKILNLSKLEFEKPETIFSTFNINNLIDDICDLFESKAIEKKLKLINNAISPRMDIKSDENILRVILENLINNAIKYTDKGTIKVSIEPGIIDGHKSVIIKVADTGVGIAADKLGIIWQEFRQVSEGYGRDYEGTGLGLSITKRYVELLGGTISCESKIGVGSTFVVELPLEEIDKNDKDKLVIQGKDNQSEIENNEKPIILKKILYIEDDKDALNLVRIILSKKYDIETAETSEEAFEKIKNKDYDLFLIDISLGYGMNGLELMQKLRSDKKYKNTAMVAITAYAGQKESNNFLSKGFSHYISKPFTKIDLLNLIEDIFTAG